MSPTGIEHQSVFDYYRRLAKVKAFVEKSYNQPISLECAAAIAGLEPKYFSTYFRKKTGICFRDWLADYRIQQAKMHMQSQNMTITQVSFASGFRDLRTFERTFKGQTGITPSQYKTKIQQSIIQ